MDESTCKFGTPRNDIEGDYDDGSIGTIMVPPSRGSTASLVAFSIICIHMTAFDVTLGKKTDMSRRVKVLSAAVATAGQAAGARKLPIWS